MFLRRYKATVNLVVIKVMVTLMDLMSILALNLLTFGTKIQVQQSNGKLKIQLEEKEHKDRERATKTRAQAAEKNPEKQQRLERREKRIRRCVRQRRLEGVP